MGIDKHLILTLDRSRSRHWAVFGGSLAMQTPPEKIEFVRGHDNKDFRDDMYRVADAAEADGFPYVHQFAQGVEGDTLIQSASGACQVWNLSRIFRYIAEGDETCLVTWDDRILTLPFPFIDRITTTLQNREEDFYFWQLRVKIGDSYYTSVDNLRVCHRYPELVDGDIQEWLKLMRQDWDEFNEKMQENWENEHNLFMNEHCFGDRMKMPGEKYVEKYLQKNRLGYDESMVISPKGAAWFLLQAYNMVDLEFQNEADTNLYWNTYIYRRNTFDSWMIGDLDGAVEKLIELDKGIYCPKKMGYRYVHDWLPMGSDLKWANKLNKEAESIRTKSTDMKFIDIP